MNADKDILNIPISDPNSTTIFTYDNADKCSCDDVSTSQYVSGIQGVNKKYEVIKYNFTMTTYHSKVSDRSCRYV